MLSGAVVTGEPQAEWLIDKYALWMQRGQRWGHIVTALGAECEGTPRWSACSCWPSAFLEPHLGPGMDLVVDLRPDPLPELGQGLTA